MEILEYSFAHFLATNSVPSNGEIEKISDSPIDPAGQLKYLDNEIARLQNQRNQLHDSIKGHRKLIMTPMHRIPLEILREIFVCCLPTHHNAIMSSREAPLLLGRVCSLWRNVAMSTQKLWSSIHIGILDNPREDSGKDGNIYIEAIKMWLDRSGTLPLSITLYHPCIHDMKYEQSLLATLVSFSSRWRNVTIQVSTTSLSIIASLPREAVPLLHILSLCHVPITLERFQPMPCDMLWAPRLREVSSSHLAMIPPDINWSQLTALSIGNQLRSSLNGLTPAVALDILRKCTNLISCRMEFGSDLHHSSNNYHDAVILPTLETFAITEGPMTLVPFFKHLDLPALIGLEFSARETEDRPSICALFSRVDKLKKLTISSLNITRDGLLECIKEAPASVSQFSVLRQWGTYEGVFDNEILGLLTPTEAVKPIFPCLKIIECSPCRVSDEALVTFIQARTTHAPAYGIERLECVDMNFGREKEKDITSIFGLDISDVNITLTYERKRRLLIPMGGLKQRERLQMSTLF